MDKRQERRRKFHESLLNMLYSHPPSPPHHVQVTGESDPPDILRLGNHIPDELVEEKSSSSASSYRSESEWGIMQKLTRAQRKRLRKKKLKEAASHRREIIGPELPATNTSRGDGDVLLEHQHQDVRQNVTEGMESEIDHYSRDPVSCTSENKQKQRRVSKKCAKEKLKPTTMENFDQHQTLSNSNNES